MANGYSPAPFCLGLWKIAIVFTELISSKTAIIGLP
jgi:hypothetical protein